MFSFFLIDIHETLLVDNITQLSNSTKNACLIVYKCFKTGIVINLSLTITLAIVTGTLTNFTDHKFSNFMQDEIII